MNPSSEDQSGRGVKYLQAGPTNPFEEFKKEEIEHSIPARFEKQVCRYPARLAVKTKTQSLTYQQLNAASNRVAHSVLTCCGRADEPIALLFNQGAPLIAATLGVLKAGKPYVPLDDSLPRAKGIQVLKDVQARLILTDTDHLSLAYEFARESSSVLNVEHLNVSISSENPGLSISPDQIAYIYYTSGSTGEPKGVVWNHRNELYGIMVKTNALHVSPDDRVSLLRSNNVGAARDTLLALLNGASLFPLELDQEGLSNLTKWLIEEEITIYTSVATVFRHSVRHLTGNEKFFGVRLVHIGGEPVTRTDVELYKKHFSDECLFVNRYSISETQAVSYYFINKQTEIKEERVPVGYPLEGNEVLILDENGRRLGANQLGEIAVRSWCLALGYWRRPELTRAKFLPDPKGGSARIYLTGDLGYILPDGCLVHVGRKDFQTKIRGHRINTNEIESMLLRVPCIKEAAVAARESNAGDMRLVAYIVFKSGLAVTISQLRDVLSERLPEHMIPSIFVILSALPLTPNGKVDRRALPDPPLSRPELDIPFVLPRTSVEEKLAQIWSQVLEVDKVGVDDNFFDLGGDSLLASRVLLNLSKPFRFDLSMRDFFKAPTVAATAQRIEKRLGRSHSLTPPPILPIRREGSAPLSFSQEQLWLLNELLPRTPLFNLSSAYRLTGSLDLVVFKESLMVLVKRHEALRTVFAVVDGQARQIIGQSFEIEVPLVDLRYLPAACREKEASRLAGMEASRPFDLVKGPLLRTKLFRLAEDEHVLLVTMHHIVSDAWSIQVFWNELSSIYKGLSRGHEPALPVLPVQFADCVYWEQQALENEVMKKQLAYWEKQLGGTLSTLVFNRATKRNKTLSFRTAQLPIELHENLFCALKDFSRKECRTPFMVLLSALGVTLYLHTGQNDIRVGTLVANRDRAETARLIGHLINTVVLRNRVYRNMTLRHLLMQVRDTTLAAYAHQHLPFEHLVRTLERKRKIRRTSLCQVMFIYHNVTVRTSEPASLIFEPHDKVWRRADLGMTFTTFDLILTLEEKAQGLAGSLTFKCDSLDFRKAKDFLKRFIRLLEYVMENPESTIRKASRHLGA